MDQKQIVKQMVDIQRISFSNGFDAIVRMQDQAEKMANSMMAQATWMPAESRGAVNEWVKIYKKGRDDFKKAVEDGYKSMEDFLTTTNAATKA